MYQYWAAARVGYNPQTLMNNLKTNFIANRGSYQNLHLSTGGGGIENLNIVPPMVTEMLLQSHQHVIRVFNNWPTNLDASFGNLRAYGAFLVSSELKAGTVQYIRIVSEKGRPATVRNPWSGKNVTIYRNGIKGNNLSGEKLNLTTSAKELIVLVPEGTNVSITTPVSLAHPVTPSPRVAYANKTIRIAPNPAGRYLVSVMNLNGRVIGTSQLERTSILIDLTGCAPGIYLWKIHSVSDRSSECVWKGKVAVY
jgi:hypothetical protein